MSGYIGNVPVPQATQTRETFTATASQTSFATAGYNPGYIDVFLNGVKLVDGTDYTATNGSDVVLSTGAAASDILEVVAYSTFEVLNQSFTGTTTADNLTVTGAFTSQGIDDNATATAITLDSSGNVGIGTSSPAAKINTSGAVGAVNSIQTQILLSETGTNTGTGLEIKANNSTYSWDAGAITFLREGAANSYSLVFDTSSGGTNAERMRIDSSGNLLVGKTVVDTTTEGVVLANQSYFTRTGGNTAFFNRNTTDGNIIAFGKDSTTVGSIGTFSAGGGDNLTIGGGDTRLMFLPSSDAIIPRGTSDAARDNAIDLGSSTNRFKDLYLSGGVKFDGVTKLQGNAYIIGGSATNGIRFNNNNDSQNNLIINDDGSTWIRNGIYLGATSNPSAANHLDDYETGTFTPRLFDASSGGNEASYSQNEGTYIKIGDMVYYRFSIILTGKGSMTSGNTAFVQGFPFTSASIAGNWYDPSPALTRHVTITYSYLVFHNNPSSTYGYLYDVESGGVGTSVTVSSLATNTAITVSGSYRAA